MDKLRGADDGLGDYRCGDCANLLHVALQTPTSPDQSAKFRGLLMDYRKIPLQWGQ